MQFLVKTIFQGIFGIKIISNVFYHKNNFQYNLIGKIILHAFL